MLKFLSALWFILCILATVLIQWFFPRNLVKCDLLCSKKVLFLIMTLCQELKEPQLHKAPIQTTSLPISWAYHNVTLASPSLKKHRAFIFNSAAHFSISTSQLSQPMCDPIGCWQLNYTAENLFQRDWNFPLISLAISDKHEVMPVDIWQQTLRLWYLRIHSSSQYFLTKLFVKRYFFVLFSM